MIIDFEITEDELLHLDEKITGFIPSQTVGVTFFEGRQVEWEVYQHPSRCWLTLRGNETTLKRIRSLIDASCTYLL
jgi:hypothetical protein